MNPRGKVKGLKRIFCQILKKVFLHFWTTFLICEDTNTELDEHVEPVTKVIPNSSKLTLKVECHWRRSTYLHVQLCVDVHDGFDDDNT